MGVEPAVSAALAGGLAGLEPILDVLPSPLLLIEPGTARVVYANRAAHALAGGTFPMSAEAGERMLGVHAERGEPFANEEREWASPGGVRSLLVSGGDVIALAGGERVSVVTFQEVSELQAAYADLREAEGAVRRSRDELDAILGGVADSVTAQTPDGRLVYANQAAVQMLGFDSVQALLDAPLAEVAGRFEMLSEDGGPLDPATLPGRLALQGQDPEPLTVRYRAAGDRETRWSRVKSSPVREHDGSVRLAINVIEDITELKRSEAAHRFLAEAGRILSGSLEFEETLATVARLAVPGIADWCAVDLRVDDDLKRVAVAHVDPEKRSLAQELERRYPPDPRAPTGAHAVMRSGSSQLIAEIPDELLVGAAYDEEHLALLRTVGIRSAMMVPMALHDDVMGVISFVSAESGRRFEASDVELAESLALRAATAVENARLYRQRSAIAQTLQASLLPPALPDVPGFELAAAYRAAGEGHEVGGDFYDVFGTAEDQWYAVIGDVCGKGAEAAAVTALARYTIRAAAVRRRSPAAILGWLNDVMLGQQESSGEAGRFCTIACVHVDLRGATPRVTVACGGHPLPALLRADGSVEELGTPGTAIGLVDDPELADVDGELRPGDTIVLYTDGLTEARAPKHVWSPADLAATLAGARGQGPAGVVDHLVRAALGDVHTPRDDVAVLALHATGSPPAEAS